MVFRNRGCNGILFINLLWWVDGMFLNIFRSKYFLVCYFLLYVLVGLIFVICLVFLEYFLSYVDSLRKKEMDIISLVLFVLFGLVDIWFNNIKVLVIRVLFVGNRVLGRYFWLSENWISRLEIFIFLVFLSMKLIIIFRIWR